MSRDPAIAQARREIRAMSTDRQGCIRIRRQDCLDMLDLIDALSAEVERLQPRPAPMPRFAQRHRLSLPSARRVPA